MRSSFIASSILHLSVIIFTLAGLPGVETRSFEPDPPVIVELMDIAEISNLPTATAKQVEPPKVKPTEPPKPTPTQVAKVDPQPAPEPEKIDKLPDLPPVPDVPKAQPPEPKLTPKPPEPVVAPVPDAPAIPEPQQPEPEKSEEPPAQPSKQLAKMVPNRKPPPPKKVEKQPKKVPENEKKLGKKKENSEFDKVLQTVENLDKSVDALKTDIQSETLEAQSEVEALSTEERQYNNAVPLSLSEADALRSQLARCWSIPAGAKDAEDLVVRIKVAVNPDRTVASAQIVDQQRMAQDAFYRAAAESALRAVLDPMCSPLRLPPAKYDTWKQMNLEFSPKEMLGL